MEETIRKNEKCFIGMPSCGYGYESAKMCFIACPSGGEYKLKTQIIKDTLESKQYECHIALRTIDPGNFAFCTKICSKIIQSQFCIVLLDPSIQIDKKKKQEYPNPNVYFEYGMMISQNKHVIPLQNKKYELPFNIFPLDTIKYTQKDFRKKVGEAIDDAIKRFSERKVSGQVSPGPEIFTFYNLKGFNMSNIKIPAFELLYTFGSYLGFFLFNKQNNYKYIGPFDYEDPKKIILHTKLLTDNIISAYEGMVSANPTASEKYNYLIKNISVDLIVPPFFAKEDIQKRIKEITNNKYPFSISIYYRMDVKKTVEEEYQNIGDIKKISRLNS